MHIYYQGIPGAYSDIAAEYIQQYLSIQPNNIIGLKTFDLVWDHLSKEDVALLPIENSYAGTVHRNIYNFLRYKYKIIGEINMPIQHCLLTKEHDIKHIKKAYSHPQALAQCFKFLRKHHIEPMEYSDTALAVNMVSKSNDTHIAAIGSHKAGDLYNLYVVEENIQDQDKNTTRFLAITPKKSSIMYTNKKGKIAILFQARNLPGILYKCLGAFATNNIDLTKIESLPSQKDPFNYMFWVECKGTLESQTMKNALEELEFFTKEINILGEY